MIDSKTTFIAIPCHDGRLQSQCAMGLAQSRDMVGNIALLNYVSSVNLARNMLAHQFVQSSFEWMVFIDSDIGFCRDDMALLLGEGLQIPGGTPASKTLTGVDELVTAEYSKKTDALEPARFGLGFTRIHRGVFAALAELTQEDGAPRLWHFTHQGQMYIDYFPCGPMNNQWFGEDMGFFQMCRLGGIVPRIEQRTHLVHWGQKGYSYQGPASFGGA